MEQETQITIIVIIGIIVFTTIGCGAYYMNHKLKIDNFQATIENLSDEQKCIHICGFEFHNVLDNYKFCIEKCDRISEREANSNGAS